MEKFFVENLEPNITRLLKALKEISGKQESQTIISLLKKLEGKDDKSIVNAIKSIPKTEINEVSVKESQAVLNKLQAINDAIKLIKLDKVSINEAKDLRDGLAGVIKAVKAKDLNIDLSVVEVELAGLLKAVKGIEFPDFKLPKDQLEALKPFEDYATREGQDEIVEAVKKIKISGGGGGGAYPVVGLKASDNITQISPATEDKQDPLSAYKITDIDDVGYYGFMTADGAWYIMSSVSGYRYIKGDSDYATNWGNRASLSYLYYNQIF